MGRRAAAGGLWTTGSSTRETMTHCKEGRQPMFWQFTKTFTMSLAILCLVSSLALAQAGGTGGSGGTGASGSPGGSGSMGTGPGNPGTVPSPGQPSPGGTLGRSGDPVSPPPLPDTTNPSMRGMEPPGTFTTPETSRDRELRQQGEAPRTEPGTDLNRRSGREIPGGTDTSIPDSSGTSRTLPR
jgi:hypothetical protein